MTAPRTIQVTRRETFNAAHQLRDPNLTEDENRRLYGKCVNQHGHNYVLEVTVGGAGPGAVESRGKRGGL